MYELFIEVKAPDGWYPVTIPCPNLDVAKELWDQLKNRQRHTGMVEVKQKRP